MGRTGSGTDKRYVVRGAMVACDKGSVPSKLNLPKSHGVYVKDHPVLIDTDREPNVNVMPFGSCQIKSGPCDPATVPLWANTKENTLINGRPSLIVTSFLTCTIGGAITIKDDGQSS